MVLIGSRKKIERRGSVIENLLKIEERYYREGGCYWDRGRPACNAHQAEAHALARALVAVRK
jgi:hypothetical protein